MAIFYSANESEYNNEKSKTMNFRSTPLAMSQNEVEEMLIEHGFYDSSKNPQGKGIKHQYKSDNIDGDKVVIDKQTNLTWQQGGTKETVPYIKAKSLVQNMNKRGFAGFTDWRLPTLEEAMSLMERDTNSSYVWEIENRADKVALALLAPPKEILSRAELTAPQFEQRLLSMTSVLCTDFGLPVSVAKSYGRDLLMSVNQGPSWLETLRLR